MSWPIAVDAVVVGAKFKRTWHTPSGKQRFQIREVTEVGTHLRRFEPQMNPDCCAYLIVGGFRTGETGSCARLALSQWADEMVADTSHAATPS